MLCYHVWCDCRKENEVEPMYRMCMQYLEMEPRTEVLNKRLDLLRELLSVLQQQVLAVFISSCCCCYCCCDSILHVALPHVTVAA